MWMPLTLPGNIRLASQKNLLDMKRYSLFLAASMTKSKRNYNIDTWGQRYKALEQHVIYTCAEKQQSFAATDV
jgi:hypothetical protein